MTETILQHNLVRLLEQREIDPFSLDRKAGINKGTVYNILKGRSKRPSADTLQAIADVFGITIKDLYEKEPENLAPLNADQFKLLTAISEHVSKEVALQGYRLTYSEYCTIIHEVFKYAPDAEKPDRKFVSWVLKQKHKQKLNSQSLGPVTLGVEAQSI